MYRELLEVWRRESESEEIQPLPKNFYRRLSLYFRSCMERARIVDPGSPSAALLKAEVENSTRLFRRLYELRMRKLISTALKGGGVNRLNLTDEEMVLLNHLEGFMRGYEELAERVIEGRELKVEPPSPIGGMMLVRFLRESPAIVGVDLKTYGPFKPEDVAYIPRENAEALEKKGVVVRIKPEP